jgi:hypothetical protein
VRTPSTFPRAFHLAVEQEQNPSARIAAMPCATLAGPGVEQHQGDRDVGFQTWRIT